jgi:hypothetical protein
MTNQNSGEGQAVSGDTLGVRPDEVMKEFDIKKDAYYDRIKFLGIKAAKDNQGKAYLSQEQFDLMRSLDSHIKATGTMDGFILGAVEGAGGGLAIAGETGLMGEVSPMQTEEQPMEPGMEERLIRQAMQLKAKELVTPELVVRALANRLTYEDLDDDLKEEVDMVKESASPKFQPSTVADKILDKFRDRQNQQVVMTA